MTDDYDTPWAPTALARDVQAASEEVLERQTALARQLFAAGLDPGVAGLGAMSRGVATFKTRVQSGGRISIPDAEREALDIHEGDIVQAVVLPVTRRDREEGGRDA